MSDLKDLKSYFDEAMEEFNNKLNSLTVQNVSSNPRHEVSSLAEEFSLFKNKIEKEMAGWENHIDEVESSSWKKCVGYGEGKQCDMEEQEENIEVI